MQTTYGHGSKHARRKRAQRKKEGSGRQLAQLLLCLAVFFAVFIGKGVWPSKVAETGTQLLRVIRANTDFRAAFASLGQSLSQQESVLGEIGEFCVTVFAPERQEKPGLQAVLASGPEQELRGDLDAGTRMPESVSGADISELTNRQHESALHVGDVVQAVQVPETELPDGYSAQWLFLGGMETVTPVMGTVTSQFGYRDHPTMSRYAAHGGVDIAADKGTAIAAFADGTVVNVGESDDFGLYLQIEHPNAVSTFYSHCHKIFVQEGEQVTVGQTVAQVGSTGQSTGPHLHFEVHLDGVRLNPMHYIDPSREV